MIKKELLQTTIEKLKPLNPLAFKKEPDIYHIIDTYIYEQKNIAISKGENTHDPSFALEIYFSLTDEMNQHNEFKGNQNNISHPWFKSIIDSFLNSKHLNFLQAHELMHKAYLNLIENSNKSPLYTIVPKNSPMKV